MLASHPAERIMGYESRLRKVRGGCRKTEGRKGMDGKRKAGGGVKSYLMKLHLRATGCHFLNMITECYMKKNRKIHKET